MHPNKFTTHLLFPWVIVLAGAASAVEAPLVRIQETGGRRIITSNGIPDHNTGAFPNQGNPHRIEVQRHRFEMTLTPKAENHPIPLGPSFFGVAINGIPFEAGTAEFWRGQRDWNYEAKSRTMDLGLDQHDAHVQPGGVYHYHGLPAGLNHRLSLGHENQMILLGWAADGYPIYAGKGHSLAMDISSPIIQLHSSYRLKTAMRPGGSRGPGGAHDGTFTNDYEYQRGTGELDECNGRFGVTPEYPKGIYHYHITPEFPHISRQWKGEPDRSFFKHGGPRFGPPNQGRMGGPGFRPRDRNFRN
jgi:hypothetical protein